MWARKPPDAVEPTVLGSTPTTLVQASGGSLNTWMTSGTKSQDKWKELGDKWKEVGDKPAGNPTRPSSTKATIL